NAARSARRSGESAHNSVRRDPADGVVPVVSDVNTPRRIQGQAPRKTKSGRAANSVHTTNLADGSSQGAHRSIRSDFANGRIVKVGDVDHSRVVHRDAMG